jgi:ribonuclease BN (tRNA processing enzyme)
MELTVLGTHGTWPGPGGETSGYLVSHGGAHLWMDAGTGTFARLQQRIAVADLSAILITHGHADHFVDILPAFYARHYGKLGPPDLPFYSPPGFTDLAALLTAEDGRDVMSEAYAFTTMRHGDRVEVGPFAIDAFEMTHVGVDALGFRVAAGGRVLAYTGDTGPCPSAVELARDADLFLAEATYQDATTPQYPFHLSARQAAEHAVEAGARALVLTHILPTLDPSVSAREAAEVYRGPITVAETGMVMAL